METIKLPPPAITHPLILDIVAGIHRIFDDRELVGMYLGGSLATGGFDADTSDLDFLVVLQASPTAAQRVRLKQLHALLRSSDKNRLYQDYDGDYLTIAQTRRPTPFGMRAPRLATDGHFAVTDLNPGIIINLWKIYWHGFTIFGPSPRRVIAAISTEQMLRAKTSVLTSLWLPKLQTKPPMNDGYQVFAVLTMARILYGLAMKGEPSKSMAATWAMKEYPLYAELFKRARDWRPEKPFNRTEEVYGLIEFVGRQT